MNALCVENQEETGLNANLVKSGSYYLWLALWLLIQWIAYKLIFNPLIDYIRSHVCLCVVVLYSKASSSCYLLTVGWYTVVCKPNLYVYALMYNGKSK